MVSSLDEYPLHQVPLPVTWAGTQRPELLRPLLPQRARPQRRHLPDHRDGLLPEPRHQGRVRARTTRRRADRGPPLRRDRRRPPRPARRRLPDRGRRAAAQAARGPRGDRGDRPRPDLGGLLRRTPGAAARDARRQPGDPQRPALRAGRHLVRAPCSSTARRPPSTPDRWVGTRDRSWGIRPVGEAAPAGRAGGPAVRGHVVDLRAAALRGVRRGADPPGGPRRLPHPQRLPPRLARRPGRAARLAAGRHPLRLGHPRPDRRLDHLHDARRQAAPARGRVAAAGADPRRRRLRRRPRLDPRTVEGPRLHRAGHLRPHRRVRGRPDHVRRHRPRRPRAPSTAPRASGSSSTAPSAATTPAASPTGSPSPPDRLAPEDLS